MMRTLLLFTCILVTSRLANGQELTNKGKDFWLCFPSHVPNQRDGVFYYAKMSLFITSDKISSGTISVPGVFNASFTVIPGQAAEIDIPYSIAHINVGEAGTVVRKGIHVHVDQGKPGVVVYAHIYAGFRSAASLVLPVPVLGKKYFSMNALQRGIDGAKSQFVVVSVYPNTVVRINPVKDGIVSTPFTVNLPEAGDVYEMQDTKDLSGTLIESIPGANDGCRKIAVFAGSSAINIATNPDCISNDSYDPLYQQLYPVNAWGKKYGFIPFENYSFGNPYRILAAENNTIVKLNGNSIAVLNAGEYYPANNAFGKLQVAATFITADKPISVAQYAQSSACSGTVPTPGRGYGDADMVMLNPVEQNVNNITVFSSQKENIYPDAKFINILIPQNATGSFKINNTTPMVNWQTVQPPASGYAYAKINLPTGLNAFSLNADSAFNAIAYGFGDYESYAYSAGTNVKDLYRVVTIKNEFGSAAFPASCKKTRFKILVTFPYKTNLLKWKFNGSFADQSINNPVAIDSFLINDKKVYQYKLDTEFQITTVGEYTFSIIANNPVFDNCQGEDEIEYNLQIFDRPHADFNFANNCCITDSVLLRDQSDTDGRNTSKWFWDFGDNIASTEKSPVHKYSSGNEYTVQHWFVNDIGCISDTLTKTIPVSEVPVAKFNAASSVCQHSAITFTDASLITGVFGIGKRQWDFGDTISVVNNNNEPFIHVYSKDTSLIVSLQVETVSGCKSNSYQQVLRIHPRPVANFIVPVFCMPQSNQFINQSLINGSVSDQLMSSWNFGDGAISTDKDPYHQYTDKGPFNVALKVVSKEGCENDTVKVVNTIFPLSHLQLSAAAENCLGDTTRFIINTTTSEGNVLGGLLYSINDAPVVSISPLPANPETLSFPFLFPSAGKQNIKLFAKISITGCYTDTISKIIYISRLPSAAFNIPYPLCDHKMIQFSDASLANEGNIIKWKWDFENGNISSVQNAEQLFNAGSYNIHLSVETDKGCKAESIKGQVKINSLPKPYFEMPGICANDGVAGFVNGSSIEDGSDAALVYLWHFGDAKADLLNPDTSSQKDPSHRYTKTGFYNVGLNVVSEDGCIADTVRGFTVNGTLPKADFIVKDSLRLCSNKKVIIENNSIVNFGNITRIEIIWDNDHDPLKRENDPNPYIGKNYIHNYPVSYNSDKAYTIKFIAYSGNTCMDEIKRIVLIRAIPLVQLDVINNVCENIDPFRMVNGYEVNGIQGLGTYYGKGITPNGLFDPIIAKPGFDTIKYTFITPLGCEDSKKQVIKVLAAPSVNAGQDKFISENETVFLNGSGSGNGFSWLPLISITGANTATPSVSPNLNTIYTLAVTSSEGCKASDDVMVKVFSKLNIPNAFTPNNDGLNDTWKIPLIENYGPNITVQIFNRYGQRIFYSEGYIIPWNGTFKGDQLSAGTYTYLIDLGKGKRPVSGFVTILR